MIRVLLLAIIFSSLIACNAKKQVEQAVNTGNYDQAITTALYKLKTNKDKKTQV